MLEISLFLAPSNKKEGSRIYKFPPRKERRFKPATQQRRVARQSKSPRRRPPSRMLPLPRRARQLPLRIFLTRKNPPISLLPRRVRLPQRKPATTKKGVGKGNAPKKAPAATDSAHSRVEPSGSLLRGRCDSPSNNTPIALDGGGEFPRSRFNPLPSPPATSSELRLRNSRQQYSPTASIRVAVPVVGKLLTSYIV